MGTADFRNPRVPRRFGSVAWRFLVLLLLVQLAPTAQALDRKLLLRGIGSERGRTGDHQPRLAIDGDPNTYSWITAPFSTGNPTIETYVAFDATPGIHRIRILQENWSNWSTPGYAHNFNIHYTTATDPALESEWHRVTGVVNGWQGEELVTFSDGGVNNNGWDVFRQNQALEDGWFSIGFDAITDSATAIMLAWETVNYRWDHWALFELEVYAPADPASIVINTLPSGRYFMLSFPLAFDPAPRLAVALRDLGPMNRHRWRGLGLLAGELEENPLVETGWGYWICAINPPDHVRVDGLELPPEVITPLTPGWNLIGVPRQSGCLEPDRMRVLAEGRSRTLAEAVADSHLAGSVWWWQDETPNLDNMDGTFLDARIDTGTVCGNPWGGYLVFAEDSCRLVHSTDPSEMGFARHGSPLANRWGSLDGQSDLDRQWDLSFCPTRSFTAARAIEIGCRPGSREGYDPQDVYEPPSPWSRPRVVISQDGGAWHEYRRAYDPPGREVYCWTIGVTGPGETAALSWQLSERFPHNVSAYLVDPKSGEAFSLRLASWHDFLLHDGRREFHVLVTHEPPHDATPSAEPNQLSLRAIPSPALGPVDIRLTAPRAGAYCLDALDVSGRVIDRILLQRLDRGPHTVRWAGPDPSIGHGVLFLRLRGPDGECSQRVLLNPSVR